MSRLRIWIPDKDEWIHEALEHTSALYEEVGVPSSKSHAAYKILKKELAWFYEKKKAEDTEDSIQKEGRMDSRSGDEVCGNEKSNGCKDDD